MYDADYKKPYVATYKEVFIAFVVFIFILIFLYPKDLLREQVLSKNANYDLSILYLQNMIKDNPHDEELMLQLAKKSLYGSKRDLSYKLLKILQQSKNAAIRKKAYLLNYKITKEDYFAALKNNQEHKANKLYADLQDLNRYIITHHLYSDKELVQLYKETQLLHQQELSYRVSKEIVRANPTDILYLKNAYYLATSLHHNQDALNYAGQLAKIDTKEAAKWKEAQYYILFNYFTIQETEKFLIEEAQHSQYWMKKLAEFYLNKRLYKKASSTYMKLFEKSTTQQEKIYNWEEAIKALQAGNYFKEAAELGEKYQHQFIRNKNARIFLLQLFLATNELQKADAFAAEILKLKEKRL
jgi:hypothetical protein